MRPFIPFGQGPFLLFRRKYTLTFQLFVPVTAVNMRIAGTSPLYNRSPEVFIVLKRCNVFVYNIAGLTYLYSVSARAQYVKGYRRSQIPFAQRSTNKG